MKLSFPLFIRHTLYNLRGGFLIRPLIIAVVLGCVGGLLSSFEVANPATNTWVPHVLFPSHADPQVAQIILGDIAGAVMTVVSIVFAILLMTLTLASMQFSPRIIVSFARDRVTQWTLGVFLGTFCYCITALPAAHSRPSPEVPVLTVMGAMILALACVCLLLFFIHHISQAISASHIIDRIATETEAVIDDIMPLPIREAARRLEPAEAAPAEDETPVLNRISGYIRFTDSSRLLELAKEHGVCIRVLRRVGQFVPEGVPILMVAKAERISDLGIDEALSAFDIGPTRTFQQDVEFGLLQIVDISLRAVSPAVNDPTTAIGCVDQLSRIVIRFASRELPESLLYDPPGKLRVSVPQMTFDRMMDAAFDQIRLYARNDIAVSMRLLRAYDDIGSTIPNAEFRRSLARRAQLVVAGCEDQLPPEEMKELRARLEILEPWL